MSLLKSDFVDALQAVLNVPVLIGGDTDVDIQSNEHSAKLVSVLDEALPNQIYANSTKEQRDYPDCVYEIGGSSVLENLSVATGSETAFLLTLRDETHDAVTKKFDEVKDLIGKQSGMQITDLMSGYNETTGTHEVPFELVFNTPLGFDGEGSVVAIRGACQASENQTYPCLQQDETCEYHFIIQAKDQKTLSDIKAKLQVFVLGFSQSSQHGIMNKGAEQPLQSSGGLVAMAVTYHNTQPILAEAHKL